MEDDPALGPRGCMVWDRDRWNVPLLGFYRSLAELRRASEPLLEGGFQVLSVEPDTLAYQREGRTGRALVIAHRGERPRPARPLEVEAGGIPSGTRFVEHFSGRSATVTAGLLPLPELAQGGTIWLSQQPQEKPRRRGRPRRNPSAGGTERRCPGCGRTDGSRLDAHLTARATSEERRWVCLWCGTIWKRTAGGSG
ncbi:MAG: hypothetical protein QM767_04495 [Anaeromyxobacter sp.]